MSTWPPTTHQDVQDQIDLKLADADFQVVQVGMGAAVETTGSTTYVDLATVGPVNTVTISATGRALVIFTSYMSSNGADNCIMAVAVSGATTRATDENRSMISPAISGVYRGSSVSLFTGLNPGSTTFTCKYRVSGSLGSFTDRQLVVVPL